jgi:MFS family permease
MTDSANKLGNNDQSIWGKRYFSITVANLTVVGVAAFDGLAIIAALPNITEDLGNVSLTPWVLTSFLATSALAAIVAGPIIDAVGVRKTFQVTGIWFLVTSAAAAASPTLPLLIVSRALQGIGGGLVIAVALAAVGIAYPPNLRPRAFAANSMVWGTLGLGGPALTAVLLGFGGWRFVFVVQLPITAIALLMGWNTLPDKDEKRPLRNLAFDYKGILFLATAITSSLIAVTQIVTRWWVAVALLVVTIVVARAYWVHSDSYPQPVLERQHLTRFPFRLIHLASGLVFLTGFAVDNYLPLYIQTTRGRSESFAAFSVVYLTVGWTAAAFIASKLLTYRKEEEVILGGSALMPGVIALAGFGVAFNWPVLVLFSVFFFVGVSIGLVSTSGLTLLQSQSKFSEMGRSNSAHQFVRTLAITYGVAAGGAILLAVVNHRTGDVEAVRNVLRGNEKMVDASTREAIGSGFAWIHAFSFVAALLSLGAAISLKRARAHLRRPVGLASRE